nr:medium-chain acyl-CoA ligase ACSF2, mitochondrial-like [Lytechinus pictus]
MKVGVKVLVAARPFKIQNYYNILNEVCPELETSSPGSLKSKRLPDLKSIIMMGEEPHPGTFLFGDVMDMGGSEEHDVIDRCRKTLQFDDVANIQFTSVTTGNPKATCLTHFHVVNNVQTLAQLYPGDARQSLCVPTPMFHVFGMFIVVLGTLTISKTVSFTRLRCSCFLESHARRKVHKVVWGSNNDH